MKTLGIPLEISQFELSPKFFVIIPCNSETEWILTLSIEIILSPDLMP